MNGGDLMRFNQKLTKRLVKQAFEKLSNLAMLVGATTPIGLN
jgi:hypothetical protein